MSRQPGIPPGLARRILDVVAAGLCLLILAPAMLAIAVVVRVTSPGPAIFKQERIGQGLEPFTLWKFRTMRSGAEGSDLTLPDDPRITWVGSFLRRVRFDELPQLVNVFRGDMTLVGPRPEAPSLARRYPPEHAIIFRYRPGLTGPGSLRFADVDELPSDPEKADRFYFGELTPERVRLDMVYLMKPTLGRTIGLLFGTIRRLFQRTSSTQVAEAEPGL